MVTNTTGDVRTLKRLVLDRSLDPVLREVLDTLLHYVTQELPNRGLQSQERTVRTDSVCRNVKKTEGSNAARRLTAFQLLQSKFLLTSPKPAVTHRREVGSLHLKGLQGAKEVDRPSSNTGRGKRGGRSRVQDVIAKFAAAEQKERGLETRKVLEPQKLVRQISKGPLLSGMIKKFEALAKMQSRRDLTEGKKHKHTDVSHPREAQEQQKHQGLGIRSKQNCFLKQVKDGVSPSTKVSSNSAEEHQTALPVSEWTQWSSAEEEQALAFKIQNNDVDVARHINNGLDIPIHTIRDRGPLNQENTDKDNLGPVNNDVNINGQVGFSGQVNSNGIFSCQVNSDILDIMGHKNDAVDYSSQLKNDVEALDQLYHDVDTSGHSLSQQRKHMNVLQRKVRFARAEVLSLAVVENSDYSLHCGLLVIEMPQRTHLATVQQQPDVWILTCSSRPLIQSLENGGNKRLGSISCVDQPHEKRQNSESPPSKGSKKLQHKSLSMEHYLQLDSKTTDMPGPVQALLKPFKPESSEIPKEPQTLHTCTELASYTDSSSEPQDDVHGDCLTSSTLQYKDASTTAESQPELHMKGRMSPLLEANNNVRNAVEPKLEEGQSVSVNSHPPVSLIRQKRAESYLLEKNVFSSSCVSSEITISMGNDGESLAGPDKSITVSTGSVYLVNLSKSATLKCYDSQMPQNTSQAENPSAENVCFDLMSQSSNDNDRDIPKSVETNNTPKDGIQERNSCSSVMPTCQNSQMPQMKEEQPKYRTVNYSDPSAKITYIPKTIRFTDTFNF